MDAYDHDVHQQEYHPSQSIPNAAYPDSPYRPGTGSAGVSQQQQRSPSSSGHASSVTLGTPETSIATSSPAPSPWTHDIIPDGPPPPYDPVQAPRPPPSAYSPPSSLAARAAAAALQPTTPSNSNATTAVEGGGGRGTPEMVPMRQFPAPSLASVQMPAAGVKLHPAEAERRRKWRRQRILLVVWVFAAFVLGIGIALISLKNRNHTEVNSR